MIIQLPWLARFCSCLTMEPVLSVGGLKLHVSRKPELVSGPDGGWPEASDSSGSGGLLGHCGQLHVARNQDVVSGTIFTPQVSRAHTTVRGRGQGVGVLSRTKTQGTVASSWHIRGYREESFISGGSILKGELLKNILKVRFELSLNIDEHSLTFKVKTLCHNYDKVHVSCYLIKINVLAVWWRKCLKFCWHAWNADEVTS